MKLNTVICGDIFNVMPKIEDKSVDMILTDMPYNTTACSWDKEVIPLDKLWEGFKRIIKDNGAIVMTGSEPFSSYLRMSNIKDYKYDWYWNKDKGFGVFLAKKQPLRTVENICIFYKKQPIYNPQMTDAKPDRIRTLSRGNKEGARNNITNSNNCRVDKKYNPKKRYPLNLLKYSKPVGRDVHPTQKPVALFQYLIKTYTNEGDTVFDGFAGSGTTGVACQNLNRKFILIEKEDRYCKIARDRLKQCVLKL